MVKGCICVSNKAFDLTTPKSITNLNRKSALKCTHFVFIFACDHLLCIIVLGLNFIKLNFRYLFKIFYQSFKNCNVEKNWLPRLPILNFQIIIPKYLNTNILFKLSTRICLTVIFSFLHKPKQINMLKVVFFFLSSYNSPNNNPMNPIYWTLFRSVVPFDRQHRIGIAMRSSFCLLSEEHGANILAQGVFFMPADVSSVYQRELFSIDRI